MPKNQRKRANYCDRHDFILKARPQCTTQQQYLHVSFCTQPPFINSKQPQPKENQPCVNCPVFNKDQNFATPTFVLSNDQNFDTVEGNRMKEDHERRMITYTDEKSELNIPKPRSKNNYCSVCSHSYSDYLEHIESHSHKRRINSSEFNRHILELTKTFKKHHPISKPIRRALIKYEHHLQSDESSIQIISNPNKKVKPNENSFKPIPSMLPTRPINQNMSTSRDSYRGLVDRTLANEQQQRLQNVQDTLSNYNFNINMNLYLNQLPLGINNYIPQSSYNPYINFQYQNLLMSQMNPLHHHLQNNLTGAIQDNLSKQRTMNMTGSFDGNMPYNMQGNMPNMPNIPLQNFNYRPTQHQPSPQVLQPQQPREQVQSRPLTYIIIDE